MFKKRCPLSGAAEPRANTSYRSVDVVRFRWSLSDGAGARGALSGYLELVIKVSILAVSGCASFLVNTSSVRNSDLRSSTLVGILGTAVLGVGGSVVLGF